MNRPTRRDLLKMTALTGCGLTAFASAPAAPAPGAPAPAAAPPAPPAMPPLNRFSRMVQEYFVARVRRDETVRKGRLEGLKTRADAEAHVASVRERIRACFGPFPEKTPLNARVTGTVDRGVYRIEKVIFESRPGLLVTGNLYLPTGRAAPAPGVIAVCGHSANGKAMEQYQSFSQGLARLGYAVFIIDPMGQGERLQYPDEALKSRVGSSVREHIHAGNQQFLVGEFFGAWRAWDGVRALDYLLSRPEVDPRHVGLTGNSGGGTMTTWLCALDPRWTMAAPSCFVTTFRRNLENELPADTEQCPPRALALGLDHEDFIAALAPKPVILLAQEKDFFDIRGTEEAFGRLRKLYGLLGAEDRIALHVGPGVHGYAKDSREAMYRWFNGITRVSAAETEPDLVIEKDETLRCTPRGQVCELGSRPLPAFTADRARELSRARSAPGRAALVATVSELLRLPPRAGVPEFRILRALPSRRHPLPQETIYAVETEPGIHALVSRLGRERQDSRPSRGPDRAVLYVAHHSSDAELRDEPLIRQAIAEEPGAAVYACDVRGIGESRPDTCGADTFLDPYGSDYFYAIHSVMLDHPYVGQKTHDVLCVLDWMRSFGHTSVHLVARGWGAPPGTFAALLSDLVTRVTLKNAPASYAAIAESETYAWPLSTLLPGVLARFDLPDCYRELQAKDLRQVEPWGALGPL